jgi:hypothetical protein
MAMNGIEISRAEPVRTRAAAWRSDEKDAAMPYNGRAGREDRSRNQASDF